MEAYILVNTEPNLLWEVAETMRKIDGVKMAHAVTGQFDVVAFVEFPKIDDLGKIIEKVQRIKGICRTQTLMVIPPTIRE